MKIAIFHNYYQQSGGEDVVFELECETLRDLGHEVFPYSVHNYIELSKSSPLKKAKTAWRSNFNPSSHKDILQFLNAVQPDVGHVHNWFPILSPAIYKAHRDAGVPVFQTLHNFRLGCASGTYRLKDKECSLCKVGDNWSAIKNRCYKGSLFGSYSWKRMVDQGWFTDTFSESVDHYICPSKEVAKRHITMGLPEEKISIIPNACKDLKDGQTPTHYAGKPGSLVYLGRMVKEKGVDLLIEAWKGLPKSSAPNTAQVLTLIGDGPELNNLKKQAGDKTDIRFLGQLRHSEAMIELQSAAALVFPSRWAEPFGLGIIEAMSAGKPVIASDIGGPSEIVKDGISGFLVKPESPHALTRAIQTLFQNTQKMRDMSEAARKEYERMYQPSSHAKALTQLFKSIIPTPSIG